jgi:hypothetical protein
VESATPEPPATASVIPKTAADPHEEPAPPEAPEVPFDPAIVEDIIEVPLPDFAEIPDELPEKLRKR